MKYTYLQKLFRVYFETHSPINSDNPYANINEVLCDFIESEEAHSILGEINEILTLSDDKKVFETLKENHLNIDIHARSWGSFSDAKSFLRYVKDYITEEIDLG
jgi:hypothetical protein